MRKLALFMVLSLLLTGLAACKQSEPALTEADTRPPVTAPSTEAATEAPTGPETQPAGQQVMDLVGSWQRTHTEVEGDRQENANATITVSGTSRDTLIIAFRDKEFERFNFEEKALTYCEGELYTDCGNALWYMEVAPTGENSHFITLLEDGSLLLRTEFLVEGARTVSHQWFVRNNKGR